MTDIRSLTYVDRIVESYQNSPEYPCDAIEAVCEMDVPSNLFIISPTDTMVSS